MAGRNGDDVEIIKTKQTIEIVFEPRKKRVHPSKELVEAESKLVRLERERELLEKKLEMSISDKKEKVHQTRGRQVEVEAGERERERAKR